jgi:hypothetical protein
LLVAGSGKFCRLKKNKMKKNLKEFSQTRKEESIVSISSRMLLRLEESIKVPER